MVAIWWVNQRKDTRVGGKTRNEVVWAPHATRGEKGEQWHWETMWWVRPGDAVIHYTAQEIVALSTILAGAVPAVNPYEVAVGGQWPSMGKRIEVDMSRLEVPIPKEDIPIKVRKASHVNKGPFQKSGKRVKQGYFFHVSTELWTAIRRVSGVPAEEAQAMLDAGIKPGDPDDIRLIVEARRRDGRNLLSLLSGASSGVCTVCERMVPVRYLKARNWLTDRRRSSENSILVCTLGCDAALRCGDISVNKNGEVVLANPSDPFARELMASVKALRAQSGTAPIRLNSPSPALH